jgi:hypothetical protein
MDAAASSASSSSKPTTCTLLVKGSTGMAGKERLILAKALILPIVRTGQVFSPYLELRIEGGHGRRNRTPLVTG